MGSDFSRLGRSRICSHCRPCLHSGSGVPWVASTIKGGQGRWGAKAKFSRLATSATPLWSARSVLSGRGQFSALESSLCQKRKSRALRGFQRWWAHTDLNRGPASDVFPLPGRSSGRLFVHRNQLVGEILERQAGRHRMSAGTAASVLVVCPLDDSLWLRVSDECGSLDPETIYT